MSIRQNSQGCYIQAVYFYAVFPACNTNEFSKQRKKQKALKFHTYMLPRLQSWLLWMRTQHWEPPTAPLVMRSSEPASLKLCAEHLHSCLISALALHKGNSTQKARWPPTDLQGYCAALLVLSVPPSVTGRLQAQKVTGSPGLSLQPGQTIMKGDPKSSCLSAFPTGNQCRASWGNWPQLKKWPHSNPVESMESLHFSPQQVTEAHTWTEPTHILRRVPVHLFREYDILH